MSDQEPMVIDAPAAEEQDSPPGQIDHPDVPTPGDASDVSPVEPDPKPSETTTEVKANGAHSLLPEGAYVEHL